MSASLNPAAAPQFLGPTPPDRVEMSPEQHMEALLNWFGSGQATAQDWMSIRAMMEGLDAMFKEQAGMQPGQPQQQAAGASMNGNAVDYQDGTEEAPQEGDFGG